MTSFRTTSNELAAARDYQASVRVSFWDRKTYGELFDENGFLDPQLAADIFSPDLHATLALGNNGFAAPSPTEAEKIICKKYKQYERLGFFQKILFWFNEPVSKYQQIYTMITLRKLQAKLHSLEKQSEEITKLKHTEFHVLTNFFNNVMGSLRATLSSFLPRTLGFFTRTFSNEKSYSHITAINIFNEQAFEILNDTIDKSYAALEKKARACSTKDEGDNIKEEIASWSKTYIDSIENNSNKIDEEQIVKYLQLSDNLRIKAQLLSEIADAAISNAEPGLNANVTEWIREDVDRRYSLLHRQLADLSDNCTLQVESNICHFNHTYVMRLVMFGNWELVYFKTPESHPITIAAEDIPGLKKLFSQNEISKEAVRKLVVEYHHRVVLKPISPLFYHGRVANIPSSEKIADIFLQLYSNEIMQHLLSNRNHPSIEAATKKYAMELHGCYNYLQEKSAAYIPDQNKIREASQLYGRLAKNVAKKSEPMKIHLTYLTVFARPTDFETIANTCIAGLQEEYRLLRESEEFLNLAEYAPACAASIRKQAAAQIQCLQELADAFKTIHMPSTSKSNSAMILSIFSDKKTWRDEILNEFKRNGIDNGAADLARKCFLHYVLLLTPPLSSLKEIFHYSQSLMEREDMVAVAQNNKSTASSDGVFGEKSKKRQSDNASNASSDDEELVTGSGFVNK